MKFNGIDMFGVNIQLKYFGKERYQSKIGAIFTLCYYLLAAVILWCIFNDYNLSPYNVVSNDSKTFDLTINSKSQMFFAFKFSDSDSRMNIMMDNSAIHAVPLLYQGIKGSNGQYLYNITKLTIKNCSELDYLDSQDLMPGYKCIDFLNGDPNKILKFGMYSVPDESCKGDSKCPQIAYNTYVSLIVGICDIEDMYSVSATDSFKSSSYKNCSTLNDANKYFNKNRVSLHYLTPLFSFSYMNTTDISTATTVPLSNELNLDMYKWEKQSVYIKYINLTDNDNYFFSSFHKYYDYHPKDQKTLAFHEKTTELLGLYITNKRLIEDIFCTIDIFPSQNIGITFRYRITIPNFIAEFMEIMTIFEVLLKIFVEYYNSKMRDLNFMGKIFDFYEVVDEKEDDQPAKLLIDGNKKRIANLSRRSPAGISEKTSGNSDLKSSNNDETKDNSYVEMLGIDNGSGMRKEKTEDKGLGAIIAKKRELEKKELTPCSPYEEFLHQLKKDKLMEKGKHLKIKFKDVVYFICCKKKLTTNDKERKKLYEFAMKYIEERLDYKYLFNTYKHIELAKSSVNQGTLPILFSLTRKPNMYNKDVLDSIEEQVIYLDDFDHNVDSNLDDEKIHKKLYDHLITIKEIIKKSKTERGFFRTGENLVFEKLLKEMSPVYKSFILKELDKDKE